MNSRRTRLFEGVCEGGGVREPCVKGIGTTGVCRCNLKTWSPKTDAGTLTRCIWTVCYPHWKVLVLPEGANCIDLTWKVDELPWQFHEEDQLDPKTCYCRWQISHRSSLCAMACFHIQHCLMEIVFCKSCIELFITTSVLQWLVPRPVTRETEDISTEDINRTDILKFSFIFIKKTALTECPLGYLEFLKYTYPTHYFLFIINLTILLLPFSG